MTRRNTEQQVEQLVTGMVEAASQAAASEGDKHLFADLVREAAARFPGYRQDDDGAVVVGPGAPFAGAVELVQYYVGIDANARHRVEAAARRGWPMPWLVGTKSCRR